MSVAVEPQTTLPAERKQVDDPEKTVLKIVGASKEAPTI